MTQKPLPPSEKRRLLKDLGWRHPSLRPLDPPVCSRRDILIAPADYEDRRGGLLVDLRENR